MLSRRGAWNRISATTARVYSCPIIFLSFIHLYQAILPIGVYTHHVTYIKQTILSQKKCLIRSNLIDAISTT